MKSSFKPLRITINLFLSTKKYQITITAFEGKSIFLIQI